MAIYSFITRKVSKQVFGDVKVGEDEDPFYETVSVEKKSFWNENTRIVTKKLAKPIPEYIPSDDGEILKSVRKKAYRLDMMFKLFGVRFGWLGIIGLIPVIGDIICVLLSLLVYRQAEKIDGGLPIDVKVAFLGNICFDFVLGLIPIVGDIIGIAYKANSRNTLALERYLKKKYSRRSQIKFSTVPDSAKEEWTNE